MDWVTWGIKCLVLGILFLLSGIPVTNLLQNEWFSFYLIKNTDYFAWLTLHYWFAIAFISMVLIGAYRNCVWTNDSKQVAHLWAMVSTIAGGFCILGTYILMPEPGFNTQTTP